MSRISDLQVGDKVRVLNKPHTDPEWVGAEGIIKSILERWWGRDENTTVELELTTDVVTEWQAWAEGDTVNVPIYKLELVEAAPVHKFPVGSIVEFWDEDNDHWQGGKGKVISHDKYVRVEVLEEMPLNTMYTVGKVAGMYEDNLREYLEPWERELLGWDEAPKAEPEKVEEEPVTPEAVNHPPHYGGDTTYETWKVAEAWGLDKDAYLFNVLKYISRAGKKNDIQEDLEKAEAYLKRRIDHPLEAASV